MKSLTIPTRYILVFFILIVTFFNCNTANAQNYKSAEEVNIGNGGVTVQYKDKNGKLKTDTIGNPITQPISANKKYLTLPYDINLFNRKMDTLSIVSNQFIGRTLSRDLSEQYIGYINSVINSLRKDIKVDSTAKK